MAASLSLSLFLPRWAFRRLACTRFSPLYHSARLSSLPLCTLYWPRNLLCVNSCVLSAASASETPSLLPLSLLLFPLPLPLGNSPLNAHCRLMEDLCLAINMKSCCEMRFHLNVIKHTMSSPHRAPSRSRSSSLSLTHTLTYSLSLSSRCRWTRK